MSTILLDIESPAFKAIQESLIKEAVKAAKVIAQKEMAQPEWLTDEEACQLLKCERTTLWSIRKKKVITVSTPSARKTLYSRRSILQFIEDNIRK